MPHFCLYLWTESIISTSKYYTVEHFTWAIHMGHCLSETLPSSCHFTVLSGQMGGKISDWRNKPHPCKMDTYLLMGEKCVVCAEVRKLLWNLTWCVLWCWVNSVRITKCILWWNISLWSGFPFKEFYFIANWLLIYIVK